MLFFQGYFLTVCPEAILQIAKHAAEKNKPFTMSLSAAYICKDFLPQLNSVLPYVDVLFGNEEEANAYAEANNFKENDLEKIVKKIASYEKVGFVFLIFCFNFLFCICCNWWGVLNVLTKF